MKETHLLSIIVPVYNMSETLRVSLDSLSKQVYKNIEVIIINDGSTDDSERIALDYKDEFLAFQYYFQKKSGVSSARNKGLELSKGDLILFMDADDYLDQNYINILLKDYKEEDIVISGITKVVNDKQNIILPPKVGVFNKKEFFEDFMSIQLSYGVYGFVSNKIFKKEIILKHQLSFNKDLKVCEDLDFFTRYFSFCNVFRISKEAGNYYCYVEKTSEIDYISLIDVYRTIKNVLICNQSYNNQNKLVLENYFVELKYAFYNEMEIITVEKIKKGNYYLKDIILFKTKGFNEKVIKILYETKQNLLLRNYLYLRKKYVNFRRKRI